MKKLTKEQKKNLTTGIIVVLLLIGVLYFGNLRQLSILPIETKSVDWKGIPVTISASGFGSNTNTARNAFCGSNDADATASSTYNVNDALSLSSSLSTARLACGPNIIYAEFEIPAGELTGTCNLRASESYNGRSVSTCKITSGLTTLYTKSATWHYQCNWADRNPDWLKSNCRSPVSDSFKLTFNNLTKIKVEITTSVGGTGSASGTINLQFIEEKIIVYRLENNLCGLKNILLSERLENDYDTLTECQENILECITPNDCEGKYHIAIPGVWGCEDNKCVWIEEAEINVYRLIENECRYIQILPMERTELDFDTLEECEQNIPSKIPILPIILIIALISILIWLYLKTRK